MRARKLRNSFSHVAKTHEKLCGRGGLLPTCICAETSRDLALAFVRASVLTRAAAEGMEGLSAGHVICALRACACLVQVGWTWTWSMASGLPGQRRALGAPAACTDLRREAHRRGLDAPSYEVQLDSSHDISSESGFLLLLSMCLRIARRKQFRVI